MSDSRLEKFIYAICSMDVSDLPVPLSRIEKLWNCLITGETPDFEPLSRNEKYLMAMLDRYDISNLPAPMSRGEKLLYKIAVGETDLSDVPGYLSRYEELLKYLIENGGISGGDFEYVLYTLNQSLYTLYTTAEKPVKKAIIYGDTLVNTLQESSSLAVTPMGEDINAQQTTVTGTANGVIKSAILKGNTLVNLIGEKREYDNNNSKTLYGWEFMLPYKLTNGKTYLAIFDVSGTINESNAKVYLMDYGFDSETGNTTSTVPTFSLGHNVVKCLATCGDHKVLRIRTTYNENEKFTVSNVMLIEYQEGMENWDIPYFEGMQSVKMPVLTTVGKNILNPNDIIFSTNGNLTRMDIKDRIEPNIDYIVSFDNNGVKWNGCSFYLNDEGGKNIYYNVVYDATSDERSYTKFNFTENHVNYLNNGGFLQLYCSTINDAQLKPSNIQIEKNSIRTPYEPYKSNILSTPSDLELRGIGNVQDTLDCLTGEVTERIGEIVLDGTQRWGKPLENGDFIKSFIALNQTLSSPIALCDKMISANIRNDINYNPDKECIWLFNRPNGTNYLYINILKSKLSSVDINGINNYFSNKVNIYVTLTQPTIKTVDLTIQDQDGNTVPHLQAFNETTHINTSSNGLIPNVVIPATVSYPSIIKPSTLYTVNLKRPVTSGSLMINVGGTEQAITSDCFTITTPSTLTSQEVIFSGKGNVISEVTVVEGDQTAKEYGYFEGIQSVKMPVLCTTGKNLCDTSKYIHGGISNNNMIFSKNKYRSYYMKCKPSTVYTVKVENSNNRFGVASSHLFSEDTVFALNKGLSGSAVEVTGQTLEYKITTTEKDEYLYVYVANNGVFNPNSRVQVEESSTATSYEPFKSNILTTPEDLELRGIGDVQDELDLTTGKLTQRIGEVVLNGSEDWVRSADFSSLTNTVHFQIQSDTVGIEFGSPLISDEFINRSVWDSDMEGINCSSNGNLVISINRDKLSGLEVTDFKKWLSQNNVTVIGKTTESIKTVDLTVVDQDNRPTELGTFENVTHVSLEAENLIPEIEMEVATNLLEDTVFNLTDAFNTLYPTAAKPVKSAILSGNTKLFDSVNNEVNEPNYPNTIQGYYLNISTGELISASTSCITEHFIECPNMPFKIRGNNKYKRVVFYDENKSFISGKEWRESGNNDEVISNIPENAKYIKISFSISVDDTTTYTPSSKIELLDDNENNLYLTHIESVKMPVLTTVGKNLLDTTSMWFDGYASNSTEIRKSSLTKSLICKVKPNTTYTFTRTQPTNRCLISSFKGNHEYLPLTKQLYTDNGLITEKPVKFTTLDDTEYVIIYVHHEPTSPNGWIEHGIYQLEEGSIATPYEPFKSNILTVNEPVELRGIGDVQDTLNCLTGELTQRIGEVVLNGTEDWVSTKDWLQDGETYGAYLIDKSSNGKVISDKFNTNLVGSITNTDVERLVFPANGWIGIRILKSKLSSINVTGFKQWLSENPVTIQYGLATESVKTVDLTVVNQDGNETKLRTFDDTTHVLLNSEGLVPTASLTVRTKIPSGSSTSLLMDDISTNQQQLETTVDEQSNNVDATMIATTEIFEDTL